MAESNNVFSNYKEMYDILSLDYIKFYSEDHDINQIGSEMMKGSSPKIIQWDILRYYIENKLDSITTKNEAELMRHFPDHKFLYYFLQGTDDKIISKLRYLILPSVKTNFKIYVSNNIFDDLLSDKNPYGFKWKVLNNDFTMNAINKLNVLDLTTFEADYNKKFRIRFLASPKIQLKSHMVEGMPLSDKARTVLQKIIFHIHGGGFIAMSSSSHQTYLRKFVKECNACVFSVDYPLSPLSKYLNTIDIIFKSYIYIIVKLLVSH